MNNTVSIAKSNIGTAVAQKERIRLLMCGNNRVFRGMLLTVLSLVKHSERAFELYIATMDLSDLDIRYRPINEAMRSLLEEVLHRSNPDSSVTLISLEESFRRELIGSKNIGSAYTPYAMIRLFADEIQGIGDKLLYLDTDVIARADISELYDIDISDYHIAGSRDFFGKFFFSARYINSGVLLMNMKRMRDDDVFRRCRELCRDKKMLLFDQHALNKYCKRKLILPRRFNEQHKTKGNTLLRHYAMTIKWFPYFHTETIKPWDKQLITEVLGERDYGDIYDEYEKIKQISGAELCL